MSEMPARDNAPPLQAAWSFDALLKASSAELQGLMRSGQTPDPERLAGYEFRGANHPWFARILGIQKFVKGFFRPPAPTADRLLEGFNCPVVQDGLGKPWTTKPVGAEPKRFGFYTVYRVRPGSRDARFPEALLLDYGASRRNARLSPVRVLRDYLVRVNPGSDELLLGKADVALGPLRLPVSYFILERLRPHELQG
jgi:hypothetical protein